MSSRHQRVFRKRGKDEQVICVNCNVLLKFDDGKSVYRRRYPLTNRLQDRKWDPSRKPGISILEGLVETNPELAAGNISQILSTMCICHDCTILLRQVVNNKFKVQNLLVELQQKIGNITNEMRLQTNKEAKETDKVIKCWACQEKFSKENTRYAMHRYIIDEMTVQEAIETVLPDESVTLQGTSKKYLLVCKNCFKFLNKIIVTQCQAETTRQSFMEKTNEDGLISKILEHGDDFDVLDYADNDNDHEEQEEMENTGDVELNPSDSVQTVGSVDGRTESGIELHAEKLKEENTEEKSLNPVTGSNGQSVKRKLEHTCSLTEEDASSIMVQEETLKDKNSDELDSEINELNETGEREISKRRKTSTDVLSILQSTNSQNDELEMNLFETELEEGNLIVDEEERPEPLNENILKKIVYHLQQNSFSKAINLLKKNSTEFEKEFQKLVVNYVRKEMLQCNTLESSDWTRLSALHSGDATLESYIEVFQENLPLLGAILSYSVSGQRQIDFTNVEKTTLLRLLTVMGVIASERSPKCCLVQSLNSIQMAEDGCTGELYNAFYGLGLCLKEKDTRELLATPDYKTHQVCWDLLKETQEIKGSATDKKDKSKAVLKDDDEISDIDEEDHDEQNLPADFADVCPYWKLPPQTALSKDGTSSEEWVLYCDTKVVAEAEPIRLIFEAAGVPYHECREPYEKIEIIGGKLLDYPTFSQPVVRKGNLTLSEIPVICRHLGELLDLCPDSAEDKIRAEQICQTCYNYLLEAKISLHGFDDLKASQAEKEKDHIKPGCESFIKNRIPKFFAFFETALKVNNSNKGFFFGDKLTYADLVMLHTLQATEKQLPDVYKQLTDILQLKTFKDKITSLPNLKAYLESH